MEAFLTSTTLVAIAEIGERLTKRLPHTPIRWIAALVFIATGAAAMLGAPGEPG